MLNVTVSKIVYTYLSADTPTILCGCRGCQYFSRAIKRACTDHLIFSDPSLKLGFGVLFTQSEAAAAAYADQFELDPVAEREEGAAFIK